MNNTSQNDTPPLRAEDDEIDLGQVFLVIWSSKWRVGLFVLTFACTAALYALNLTPIYQAAALIQLEEKSGQLSLPAGLEGLTDQDPRSVTELEIIKSRLVLGRAAANQRLDWVAEPKEFPLAGNLYRRFDHFIIAQPGQLRPYATGGERILLGFLRVPPEWIDTKMTVTKLSDEYYNVNLPDGRALDGVVGEVLQDPENSFAINILELTGENAREFIVLQRSEEETIREMRNALTVSERGRQSGILSLTYKSPEPAKASSVLDAIVETYLEQNISRNSAEAQTGLQFIEDRIPEAQAFVEQAEGALNKLNTLRNAVDVTLETEALLSQVTQLETELAALRIQEEEISRKFTKNHPVYLDLISRQKSVETRLEKLKQEGDSLPAIQREFVRLTQELELARENYNRLLIRAQELRVLQASTIGNVRVIDYAQASSRPIEPRKSRIVALALILGLISGVGYVLLKRHFHDGIQSGEEVEAMGLPLFSVVGRVDPRFIDRTKKRKWPILAQDKPTDLAVESFRSLRTSLHFGMMEEDANTLAITGAAPEAGKSFCSVNLAAVSAQSGKKVCLVDSDMRRGQLRRFFNIEKSRIGLAELLVGDVELDEVTFETDIEGLTVIPTGTYPPNPSELLMRPRFSDVVAELSKNYDLVVFDCPPALAVTDPLIIAKEVGLSLVVLRYEATERREVQALQQSFELHSVQIGGAILNDVPATRSKRYGAYGYRYAYDQKKS